MIMIKNLRPRVEDVEKRKGKKRALDDCFVENIREVKGEGEGIMSLGRKVRGRDGERNFEIPLF